MRELRHDFRRYYSVCYDEVEADEAIDLIMSLPRGSHYIASINPALSWEDWKESLADIQDTITRCFYTARGIEKYPIVTRPSHVVARQQAQSKARETSKRIKETKWEEC